MVSLMRSRRITYHMKTTTLNTKLKLWEPKPIILTMSKALNPLTMDQRAQIKNEQHRRKHIDKLHRCWPELAPWRRHQLNRRLKALQHHSHRRHRRNATPQISTRHHRWVQHTLDLLAKTSTRAKRSLRVIHGADKTGKAHLDALAEPEEQKSTTTQQHKKQQIKRSAAPKHPEFDFRLSSRLLAKRKK